jgi:sigma-E factor negative regulatory protein RseA
MDSISAFMDGEAGSIEARQAVLGLKEGGECCEAWNTYHLIGDVMRGERAVLSRNFHHRFCSSMEHEPVLITPRMVVWRKAAHMTLSAAASIAAIAIVLVLVLGDNPLRPQIQNAALPKAETVQVTQAIAPSPVPLSSQARVNEYLRAHQEYSPSTTLQGVAPYVRTVSTIQDNGR